MKELRCCTVLHAATGWASALLLLLGAVFATDGIARDRNPWAVPDPTAPAPTFRAPSDGRFAPPDYNPVEERRRRAPLTGDFVQPDVNWLDRDPRAPVSPTPEGLGLGLFDPMLGMRPWSGLYGIPGLTGHSGLYPFGTYPGSGMLWPGTGLTTPGLGLPLYGSPLGTVPLWGLQY